MPLQNSFSKPGHPAPRSRSRLIAILSILLFSLLAATSAWAARGHAQVINQTLVADNGELLRGVFFDPDTTNTLPSTATIAKMRDYGFNTLHVYGERPCGTQAPGYKENEILTLRNITRDLGLYMILTVGQHCTPTILPFGNDAVEKINFDTDFSKAFWTHYAELLKDDTHVIFEITNEPYWVQVDDMFDDDVYAQDPPQTVIALQGEVYKIIRDILRDDVTQKATPIPVLLFSYGGFRDGPGAKNDWQRVNTWLAANGVPAGLDANSAVAFHTYGSGNIGAIATAIRSARSGGDGLSMINTEVRRGDSIADCFVPGVASESPCLLKEQHELWEEEEISNISFLKLDKVIGGSSVGDLLTDQDYRNKVVAQMEENDDLIWIPDEPSATWPVRRAPSSWCGSQIDLQWQANGLWVNAGFDSLLRAESSTPSPTTAFEVVCQGTKTGLRAISANQFVDPVWTSETTPLFASANSLGVGQEFELLLRENGSLVLRSNFSGITPSWRIITGNGANQRLFDNRILVSGDAQFTYQISSLACAPPTSGDWLIASDCLFEGTASVPADITIENGAVLTVADGAILDVDFALHEMVIKDGAQVLVKEGGELR